MFKNILKAVVGVAIVPIDLIADVVTLGGQVTNKDRSYTVKRLEKIMENLDEATNSDSNKSND